MRVILLYRGEAEQERIRLERESAMVKMPPPVRYGIGLATFVIAIWAWHYGTRQSGGMTPVEQRRAMPELVMTRLDGGTWRMADHRGQVVLVNYWASWCGPCVEETPGLVRVAKELGPRGLAVVGIAMDEGGTQKVREFVDEFEVAYPVTLPPPLSQMTYGMMGLPTTVLLDRRGRVAKTYVGAVRQADFERDVRTLLAEN